MNLELEKILEKYEFDNTLIILPKNKKYDYEKILNELDSNIKNNSISIISQKKNVKDSDTLILEINTNQNENKQNKSENNHNHNNDLNFKNKLSEHVELLKIIIKKITLQNKKRDKCSLSNNNNIITSLSHQMKTPINGITTGIQVLENYLTNDFFTKILKHLLNCCLELNLFINDIIDFYLLKNKSINYNYESTLIYNIIEQVEDYFIEDFNNKKIKFIKNISIFLQTPIYIDKQRIKQILHYLINNSIKFTKNANIYLEIKYKDSEHNLIEFTLKDEGIGINENEKDKVFLPFYQVDCNNQLWMTNQVGLGLGLTNSKFF